MRFRKEMGNSCLTLEKFQAKKLGTVVLRRTLGILKPVPLSPKVMFMVHCFRALGKLLSPHWSKCFDFSQDLDRSGTFLLTM